MTNVKPIQKIIPHIWFETGAREAADFYIQSFAKSSIISDVTLGNTPAGEARVITLNLSGNTFQFLNAGLLFERNASFSYMACFPSVEEVEALWDKLLVGAQVLIPLDSYDFSERFGWLKDKFGVSWQIMHDGGMHIQNITPSLLFAGAVCGRAEEAIEHYLSVFEGSSLLEGHLLRYGSDEAPEKEGTLSYARFNLAGREFVVGDSVQYDSCVFNEMQSLLVYCDNQAELDHYWNKLSFVKEAEQCGWLKDKFGVSWQIVPSIMEDMMVNGTKEQVTRVTEAFLQMKKFDIAALERAFAGV